MKVTVTVENASIDDTERLRIASLASRIIEASGGGPTRVGDNLPYMPNEGITLFWTLDSGNDWKIKFCDESKNTFEILHRYQLNDRSRVSEYNAVNEAVKSLAGLLAYRLGGLVIVDMELCQ